MDTPWYRHLFAYFCAIMFFFWNCHNWVQPMLTQTHTHTLPAGYGNFIASLSDVVISLQCNTGSCTVIGLTCNSNNHHWILEYYCWINSDMILLPSKFHYIKFPQRCWLIPCFYPIVYWTFRVAPGCSHPGALSPREISYVVSFCWCPDRW